MKDIITSFNKPIAVSNDGIDWFKIGKFLEPTANGSDFFANSTINGMTIEELKVKHAIRTFRFNVIANTWIEQ